MTEQGLDRQRAQAARNESVFRQLNEQIEDLAADALFTRFICECMSEGCNDSVSLTLEEYEHIRGHADWFFVLPGPRCSEWRRSSRRPIGSSSWPSSGRVPPLPKRRTRVRTRQIPTPEVAHAVPTSAG